MRQILPSYDRDVDPAEVYAYPNGGTWVRANMVSSADGAAVVEGRTRGLSSEGDRWILEALRGLADVILVGAATVRAEGYGPPHPRDSWARLRTGRSLAPPIAVVTRRLDLDLAGPLFTDAQPYQRTIVFTTEAAPTDLVREAGKNAEVIVCGSDRAEPGRIIRALTDLGHHRILCEGGPALLSQLAAGNLLDELCLTVSPMLVGGVAPRILDGPPAGTIMGLSHVLEDDGYIFCRYVREVAR